MKRFVSTVITLVSFICLLMLYPICSATSQSYYNGGSGTLEDPYLIINEEQLINIEKYPSACFKLVNDISLSTEKNWDPLCNDYSKKFTGNLDGNGFSINNLTIKKTTKGESIQAGLFAYNSGTIKNLRIQNAEILVGVSGNFGSVTSGAFAAYSYDATYINCSAEGTISGSTGYAESDVFVGGITGKMNGGNIECCNNKCDIKATLLSAYSEAFAGGIVGNAASEKISCCYNKGIISYSVYSAPSVSHSNTFNVGGIAGIASNISNCYNNGEIQTTDVPSSDVYLGGIVGYYNSQSLLSYCYNTAYIKNSSNASLYYGGIAGFEPDTENQLLISCYFAYNNKGVGNYSSPEGKCSLDQFESMDTFEGFDFVDIWEIDNNREYIYPQLKKQLEESVISIEFQNESPDSVYIIEGIHRNIDNLNIEVKYKSGLTKSLQVSTYMFPSLNVNEVGIQKCELSFGGFQIKTPITFEILPKSIESIEIFSLPNKTNYVLGQPLDLSGGKIIVYYNNFSSEILDLSKADISYSKSSIGTVDVYANYGGYEASFVINVLRREIYSISFTEPYKHIYNYGDPLNLTGGMLEIVFVSDDNYFETIDIDLSMVSNFNPNIIGEQELKISYDKYDFFYSVEIKPIKVERIEISDSVCEMNIDDEACLSVEVYPQNATEKRIIWISSDDKIATVDETGRVRAFSVGSVTITAKSFDGGFSEKCIINIMPRTFHIEWIVDDIKNTIKTNEFAPIILPEQPQKIGYSFVGWTPEVPEIMPSEDITFFAVFECISDISIKNNSGSKTIGYGETLRLTAVATDMPENAKIEWYVDGVNKGEGEMFEVSPKNGSVEITVKIVDANGNVLVDKNGNEIQDSEKVSVNSGLWQKIVSFFKKLFRMNRTVVQAIFKGTI